MKSIARELVTELIELGDIEKLKEFRKEMVKFIPKELLHEEDYEVVELIDEFLNQQN